MKWTEFARRRWGEKWALCRNTAANRSRYDRCVSNSEYRTAEAAYRKAYTADALRDQLAIDSHRDLTADLFEALENMVAGVTPLRKEAARAVIARARGE